LALGHIASYHFHKICPILWDAETLPFAAGCTANYSTNLLSPLDQCLDTFLASLTRCAKNYHTSGGIGIHWFRGIKQSQKWNSEKCPAITADVENIAGANLRLHLHIDTPKRTPIH
jgi:hypothetical protein